MREAKEFKNAVQGGDKGGASDDSDDDIGPQPLPQADGGAAGAASSSSKAYGGALLPGEGEAIAQYVNRTCAFLVVVRSDIPKMRFNPTSSRDML